MVNEVCLQVRVGVFELLSQHLLLCPRAVQGASVAAGGKPVSESKSKKAAKMRAGGEEMVMSATVARAMDDAPTIILGEQEFMVFYRQLSRLRKQQRSFSIMLQVCLRTTGVLADALPDVALAPCPVDACIPFFHRRCSDAKTRASRPSGTSMTRSLQTLSGCCNCSSTRRSVLF